ncbi:uncharacterized protein LOC130725244 [Lotus japonicus]|uniref:uncharacterized protein LOC130725244 n=1 Tax=Lotus japonicus TaxID=34305 RepID=UPI002589EBA0|nr:uncharacterized protein LOC130725244 [Lotus japonicus]
MDDHRVLTLFYIWRMYINILAMSGATLILVNDFLKRNQERAPLENSHIRDIARGSVIDRIIKSSDNNCIWELRMCRNTFSRLCELLKVQGGLIEDGKLMIEEQVAIFLNILAHHKKNRDIQVTYYRSGETISRYFHNVLFSVLRLHELLLAKPEPVPQDCTDERWKYFKNCLGALDGTYIPVTVSVADSARYRTRKGHLRCFGLLKKRWAILRSPSFYPIKTQNRVILACSLLHNFIRTCMSFDPEEHTPLAGDAIPIGEDANNVIGVVELSNQWTQWRDELATQMFVEWHANRNRA